MQEFEIVFYKTENGKNPVEDFLNELNDKMRAKMLLSIRIVREKGYQARMPYSEELEDGIFELRAKVGSDISRVLYFFVIGRKIILTNGFIKKSQKTPKSEIERAKKYRADYFRREEH
ncbi:MAG: type II toxin-antitoxin system RelE/ParE family toxin [Oscillospiraceae bacterium]|nr:type II toxin-antitoxin system RelE/ParE family toxin [Oscillospiraceae bacterium]